MTRSDTAEIINREVPVNRLLGGVVVTNDEFYERNHFPVPAVDAASWRLRVEGLVRHPLSLGLRELMNMPAHTMLLTLECAGNGRSFFKPPIEGEQWGLGAVSTAEWTGVLLTGVLKRAGLQPEARELVFRAEDGFERSLRVEDIEERQVLLAYAMNGEPLPPSHGYPLRVAVPGWYAVTDVKWLSEIRVIAEAFTGFFQSERYFYEWQRDGRVANEPIRFQRVRSLITQPSDGDQIPAGEVAIRGLAWSGSAPISRVEVSLDAGDWHEAQLLGAEIPYCWRRWELITKIPTAGPVTIQSRATDAVGNTQPESAEWNCLGYGNNSIQEVKVVLSSRD